MEPPKFSWSSPQRQPLAGLVIVFFKTGWDIIKRLWPLLLLMLFNEKPGKESRYELIAALFALLTIVNSIIKFYFFRFYISNQQLIIKKGWLKKETIVVPLQKIQAVHIEESALHNILGIVKIDIDTAGSSKTEVTIDALRRPMAEALRKSLQVESTYNQTENKQEPLPILKLSISDLLKLSFSANHLEAFFILLSFGYGIYDSLKSISKGVITTATGAFPRSSALIFAGLFAGVLLIVILISTARTFLKFYDFTVHRRSSGFYIKLGLINVKEQLVSFKKIQFVAWRANWLRNKLGLWLMEYKIAGADEAKSKMKVEVPVTQYGYIHLLLDDYHALPYTEDLTAIRIHPSYVVRRMAVYGLLPALLLIATSFYWLKETALLFLFIPFFVGVKSFLLQQKFKAYACNDVLFVNRSSYGAHLILLKWHKVQTVQLQQSMYQRKNALATLTLYTAAGTVVLPYISLKAAQQVVNFSLYKIESSATGWM